MNKLPEHVLIIQSQGVDQARELKANPAAFIKKYNLLPKDQADHLSSDTKVDWTVENEYGENAILADDPTHNLAHHGIYENNPPACYTQIDEPLTAGTAECPKIIAVSHLDLDSIGGILQLIKGRESPRF